MSLQIKTLVIRTFAGLLVSIVGIAVTVLMLWQIVDTTTIVSAVIKQIQSLSGFGIQYQGDIQLSRTLHPTLSIERLVVEDEDAGYRIEANNFQLQIHLPKLILGNIEITRLHLGDMLVYVRHPASGGAPEATSKQQSIFYSLQHKLEAYQQWPLKPVLHHLSIDQISLHRGAEEIRLPTTVIDNVVVEMDAETGTLDVAVRIAYADETFYVETHLGNLSSFVVGPLATISAIVKNDYAKVEIDGQITLDESIPNIDTVVRANVPETSKIPSGHKAIAIPGMLSADARLFGSIHQLSLNSLNARWKGAGGSTLTMNGSIANLVSLDGIQLLINGVFEQSSWLASLLPSLLPSLQPKITGDLQQANLSAQVDGSFKQLVVRDINLQVKTKQLLDVRLTGQFELSRTTGGRQPENVRLKLGFTAPTTHAARVLLFEKVPEFGAVKGTADLSFSADAILLENIVLAARGDEGISVDLSGNIARIPFNADQASSGLALNIRMTATSASALAQRLGVNLRLAGTVKLAYQIEGETSALAFKKIRLIAGKKEAIKVIALGEFILGNWRRADPLRFVDLTLLVDGHDTRSMGHLLRQKLPELGAFSAETHIRTVAGKHRVEELRIRTQAGATVQAALSGLIKDVKLYPQFTIQGMELQLEAGVADVSELNAIFDLKDSIPSIGAGQVTAKITGSYHQFQVRDIAVGIGIPEPLLINGIGSLSIERIANKWHLQRVDLHFNAESSSSSALAHTLGYSIAELGVFYARVKVNDENNKLAIGLSLHQADEETTPVVTATGIIDDIFDARTTRWDVNLQVDQHTLPKLNQRMSLEVFGKINGKAVISNSDGTLGIDTLTIKSTQSTVLSLAFNGHFDDFHKPDTLVLDANIYIQEIQLVGQLLGQHWPVSGPFQINSSVVQVTNGTKFDAYLNFDDMRIDATISTDITADRVYMSGNIDVQQFFVPEFSETKLKTTQQSKDNTRVFSPTPIDFEWLSRFDLDLNVNIASFSREQSLLESVQLTIKQHDGHLSFSPVTLVYPQTKLDMEFHIDQQNPPRVRFIASGKNLDPWQTLNIPRSQQEFDTDLDLDISFSSRGISLNQMAANAAGQIRLTMKNGRLRRSLLNLLFVDVVGWVFNRTSSDPYSRIDCGIADFTIKEGVVSTNAFLLDSQHITISGEGSIDLGKEQVNYVLLPRRKSRIVARAEPVKITGALHNPTVSAVPWKSAARTYGGLVFAPLIFIGLTTANMLPSLSSNNASSLLCDEYLKRSD